MIKDVYGKEAKISQLSQRKIKQINPIFLKLPTMTTNSLYLKGYHGKNCDKCEDLRWEDCNLSDGKL